MKEEVEKEIKIGDRLLNECDYKGAIARYNKAIKLDPTTKEAYFGKAEASICIPKVSTEEILALYRKAIELDQNNAYYYTRLGAFCLDAGKFDIAEESYNKAAEIDKENAGYYYSEFGFEYYIKATAQLDEEASNEELDRIRKKALEYILKAMEMSEEDIIRLFSKK